jgi:CubicO group peptidase (beta-lactamase class C family)
MAIHHNFYSTVVETRSFAKQINKQPMKRTLSLLLLIATVLQLTAQGLTGKMDTLVSAYAKENKFNGAVLVAHKDKVIYQKAVGFADVEAKRPNDVNTIFQIGSVTKQFTSAVIMQLQQEGKLSVTDKLSKYFSGFTNGDKITIEHMLTHTSGIYNYTNDPLWAKDDVTRHRTQTEMLDMFRKYPADFEPGTKYNYSNSAYSILGYIIEQVTGKKYETVVRERILRPLGMTNSGFDFSNLKSGNKAKGYFAINAEGATPTPIVDSTVAYAAGSLYSTLGDLMKWEAAISTNKILQPQSWKAVFTSHINNYGYGWIVDSTFGRTAMSHGGGIHGFTSFLIRFPEEELVVIMLDNSSNPSVKKVVRSLAAIVLDEPYDLPGPKKEIKVAETILKQYAGQYQIAPTFHIDIMVREGRIFAQATNQPEFEIFAEKENKFFLKINDATIEFVKDGSGAVTEMILSQNGRQTKGKKIK